MLWQPGLERMSSDPSLFITNHDGFTGSGWSVQVNDQLKRVGELLTSGTAIFNFNHMFPVK